MASTRTCGCAGTRLRYRDRMIDWPNCVYSQHLTGYTDIGLYRACSNSNAQILWTHSLDDLYQTEEMKEAAKLLIELLPQNVQDEIRSDV